MTNTGVCNSVYNQALTLQFRHYSAMQVQLYTVAERPVLLAMPKECRRVSGTHGIRSMGRRLFPNVNHILNVDLVLRSAVGENRAAKAYTV